MKNFIFLSFVSLTMWSCNAEAVTTEQNNNSTKKTTDSVIVESEMISEEIIESEVADFSNIEHYAIFDTKEKLVENFGATNIKDGTSWYGEGSTKLNHSILTNPSNGHVVKYVWKEESPSDLSFIEIYGNIRNKDYEIVGTQIIGTECGLYTGMTLSAIQEWNGGDFIFSGFGWDFGGMVRQLDGTKFLQCNLSLRLDLSFDEGKDEYDVLYGDTEVSANHAIELGAPIILDEITLFVD